MLAETRCTLQIRNAKWLSFGLITFLLSLEDVFFVWSLKFRWECIILPLLADLFLYSCETEFFDNMIRSGYNRLARSFNLLHQCIYDLVFQEEVWGPCLRGSFLLINCSIRLPGRSSCRYLISYLRIFAPKKFHHYPS